MDIQKGPAACYTSTCSMDMKHGQVAWTCRMNMRHRHAARICRPHAALASSMDMQVYIFTDMHHGEAHGCSLDILFWNVPWTCRMDMQHGHTAQTCSMDMQHGHRHGHGHVTWTSRTGKQYGYQGNAVWTYGVDMLFRNTNKIFQ